MGKTKFVNETIKKEIIKLFKKHYTLNEIFQKYNVSYYIIRKIIREEGLSPRKRGGQRKLLLDERFFCNINNEIKAYWLGFLAADGNVYKNTLGIDLQQQDESHLVKLRECLSSNATIDYREKNGSCRIRFNSKIMCKDLSKWGIIPKKSSKVYVPKIKQDLIRHFIRGFFDGDGWTSRRKNKYNYLTFGMASMSKSILNFIKKWFCKKLGNIKAKPYFIKKQNCWQLLIEGQMAEKIIYFLYDGAQICLERKMKKALL